MAMHITVWGTRGGVPVSGTEFARHGGSTTHLEIDVGGAIPQDRILIDCGTGIVAMGQQRDCFGDALILQTHMHWDHIQGFPFFEPFFDPSASFEFLGVEREGHSVEEIYEEQMVEPTFPVGMESIFADVEFENIPEIGERRVGDVRLAWTELEHPSGSTAYRIETDDEIFVFSGDVEVRRGSVERLVDFARDADVFIMDAQYLPGEYDQYEGFGHSTCRDAVQVADRADVDALYLTHHASSHDDSTLDHKLAVARELAPDELIVENARDRQEIRLSGPTDDPERTSPESDAVAG